MAASEFLQQQATTSLPWYITTPLFVWVIGLLCIRSIVLIDKRAVDRACHWMAGWLIVVALLREPWVQEVLLGHGFELSDVRVMTHTAAVAAAAAIFMLGLYWRDVTAPPRWLVPALAAGVVTIGILLFVISLPARQEHIAVEELENWRTGLYMVLYSMPTPLAEILVIGSAIGLIRAHTTWARLFFGLVVLITNLASSLDHLSRAVVGCFLMFGQHNWLTDARAESNDLFFLPVIALLGVIAVPSILTSVRIHRGHDSASMAVQVLGPMWSTLTDALPRYRLGQTHDLTAASEMEHRMRIEIEDCIGALTRYLPGDVIWPPDPRGRAELLLLALNHHQSGNTPESTVPPEWLQSESQLLAVASAWTDMAGTQGLASSR